MKLILNIFLLSIGLSAIFSCRNSDDMQQQIDQVIDIYIDSLGQDMLNAKIPGSYTSVTLKDIGGSYDQVPISAGGYSLRKDKDTVVYLQYIAGAKRNLIDSVNPGLKKYESDIVLNLTKTVNKLPKTTIDTLKIQYDWSPEFFQVSKVYFKNNLVFTKQAGQPNIITIVK